MKIPEDFYEPEVRDGFYVPSEMKRYWAVTISVLYEVDRVCKKYGLKYFADYGTLMGAVRHGGFIPWDDDFDISMIREDYMKFLSIAENELPEGYKVLSIYNNHKSHTFLGRVVNLDFISTEAEFLRANHNCPYATGIDIFPIDHFDYEESTNEYQKVLINGFDEVAAVVDEDERDINNLPKEIQDRIFYLCEVCKCEFEKGKPIKQQMLIMSDRLYSIFKADAPYLAHMYFWERYNKQVFPREFFENTIDIPFEYTYIPAPICYDRILQMCYGPNYMIPKRAGGVHDYPLYSIQRNYMREAVGRVYYQEYEFSEDDLKRPSVKSTDRIRKEMVFLPFSPNYWKYMEKEWAKYVGSEEWDVYVIPIPYYRKKEYGEHDTLCYDITGYPDYVTLTGFDAYDFDNRLPDRIVIQNPYDDYDSSISVHPRFYSGLLRQITRELVYIPYFMTDYRDDSDERSVIVADYYIRVPGVTRADRILLHSEELRRLYIEGLVRFAGEETRSVWENRITADETIAPDKECVGLYEEEVPDDWWKYLVDGEGEGIKVLLFHANPGDIVLYGDKYFDKMAGNLEVFEQNRDKMSVLWYEDETVTDFLADHYPKLHEKYLKMKDKFTELDLGIYMESDDTYKSVAVADAYYGDRDAIMYQVQKLGKPVMIQNVEI